MKSFISALGLVALAAVPAQAAGDDVFTVVAEVPFADAAQGVNGAAAYRSRLLPTKSQLGPAAQSRISEPTGSGTGPSNADFASGSLTTAVGAHASQKAGSSKAKRPNARSPNNSRL